MSAANPAPIHVTVRDRTTAKRSIVFRKPFKTAVLSAAYIDRPIRAAAATRPIRQKTEMRKIPATISAAPPSREGPAVTRLMPTDPNPAIGWKGLASLRDIVALQYFRVDMVRLWPVVSE